MLEKSVFQIKNGTKVWSQQAHVEYKKKKNKNSC